VNHVLKRRGELEAERAEIAGSEDKLVTEKEAT